MLMTFRVCVLIEKAFGGIILKINEFIDPD